MKIASHNSWTYLKPKTLLQKAINFTAKCQEVNIIKQYTNYNVRCFDLRIRLNDDNKLVISHGLVEYKNSEQALKSTLLYLDSKKDVACRVMLECRTKKQDSKAQREWFIRYCKYLETTFTNIKFFGGKVTDDNTILYDFGNRVTLDGDYSSWPKKSNPLVALCPEKYAKKHNKEILAKNASNPAEYFMIDFVNIQ